MPLNKKESKIKKAMEKEYGTKKGESVFYASVNKGKLGPASKMRHAAKAKKGKK
jgi:hypothetical protein